jgi:hypothetical protein
MPRGDEVTDVDMGRSRAAADLLLEVAGPDLYRRNPFRITGVTTGAKAREVRQRRQLVLGAYDLGAGGSANDKRLPLPEPPPLAEVRAAFDAMERPDHRLVDELFWWWGEPDACECDPEVHVAHDDAVEAHARALDYEADATDHGRGERFDLWADAADAWMDALDNEGFWDHVQYRVRTLSDRRLDDSTVDGLRKTLPRALLAPQAALAGATEGAADLARLLDVWDVDNAVIDDARAAAAARTYEQIATKIKEIDKLHYAEEDRPAARRSLAELVPAAIRLETLVPHERFRRSAKLRNQIAVTINNCALPLTDKPPVTTADQRLKQELLEHSVELVLDPDDRVIIKRNLDEHIAKYADRITPAPAVPKPRVTQASFENFAPADFDAAWREAGDLIRAKNLEQASKVLWRQREKTTDRGQLAEIDSLLRTLAQAGAGKAPPPDTAANTWFLNMAMCFGLVAGVVTVVVGQWHAPALLAVLATVVLMPIPLTITYIRGYRAASGWLVLPGLVAFFFAVMADIRMFSYGSAAAWWCLIAFLLSLPYTSQFAKKVAEWGDLR